jgi:hypothetical protein
VGGIGPKLNEESLKMCQNVYSRYTNRHKYTEKEEFMKAEAEIYKNQEQKFGCELKIIHPSLSCGSSMVFMELNKSKGQLKRKVIQFCSQLNLDVEFI